MIFKPIQLSQKKLELQELSADKKNCRHFGPCGVGKKALYLNSFYIDRRFYIPYSAITRVFKRIAMSQGGFSHKGIFATIPYLVVEYDNGKEKQCTFKYEEHVDQLIAYLKQERSDIKYVSAAVEKRLKKKERERTARKQVTLSVQAKESLEVLHDAKAYLEQKPELSLELSLSARKKRVFVCSSPSYRWVALAITLLGLVSLLYGIFSIVSHRGFAMYFLLFGFAAIFTFAGLSVLPTARNNKTAVMKRAQNAQDAMRRYLESQPDFPLPACYAHPVVLERMCRVIEEGRSSTVSGALDVVKQDLRALNSSVEVDEEEYEEVVAVKAMFLNEDYR